ncbi:MAG: hypothetical protein ACPHFX_06565 [Paracoccaceae bacterium]
MKEKRKMGHITTLI